MFRSFLTATLLLLFTFSKSQTSFTVSGYILDESSKEVLIGSNIIIPSLNTGTISNSYGFYSITVPKGNYDVIFNILGYKEVVKKIIVDRNITIDILLSEQIEELSEVIITENIENIVKEILDLGLSVLIVDDNSPDNTKELIEKIMQNTSNLYLLNRNKKLGLGSAYRDGYKHAVGLGFTYFVQMDADYSHRISDLKKLLLEIENYDVIIGSRYIDGGSTTGWSQLRKYLSKYANLLSKFLIKTKIKDTTSGFRIYSLKALNEINYLETNSNGYGFQIEMTYLITKLKLNYLFIQIYSFCIKYPYYPIKN